MQIIPDNDEGGYVVYFPELPGCISSGKTIDESIKNAFDAQKEWFASGGIPLKNSNILDLGNLQKFQRQILKIYGKK